MDKTLISIIIPAFNEAGFIEHTLQRIQYALNENRNKAFEWEIILCDNNSTDRTAQIASRAGATVVFEPINQISRARNTGAEAAHGDWLLFIDADSYPKPGLIAEVLAVVRSDEYIGCGTTVTAEGGPLWNRLRIERLNPWMRLSNWCGGAFILCRRDAFEAIGGFSTGLYALEEVDFLRRLKRYGRKHDQRFAVLHRHPVVTSGRKGDSLESFFVLITSTVMSVILLILYYILPSKLRIKNGSRLLGFWYNTRRRTK